MEDFDTTVQFLPATDGKTLEKMSSRQKKLWVGVGLLLLAVVVALTTGLLVWHFNRELGQQTPHVIYSELIQSCENKKAPLRW